MVIPDERKDLRDPVIRDAVRAHLLERGNPQPGGVSPLEQRFAWICTRLGLSAIERRILGFLVRACSSAPFHSLAAASRSTFDPEEISAAVAADDVRLSTIAGVLGVVPSALTSHLVDGSPLRLFGLVEDRRGRDYAASSTALRLAVAKQLDEDKARALLFGKPRRSSLTWGDFTHLDPEASVVCGLVEAAVAGQEPGVNILLYGPHGGGKTEFAGTLAQRAGLHALFIGESDEDGNEPCREERISALALAQKLSACGGRVLLVVDEADDLFVGVDDAAGMNRRGAKVFMNRLVEKGPVPTIYICNDPQVLGSAVLRRMTYALRFPEPDLKVRERLVRGIAARRRVSLQDAGARLLAGVRAPAAVIDHGLRVASLCGGGAETARGATQSVLRAMGRFAAESAPGEMAFAEDLCCADHDIAALTRRIVENSRHDICCACPGRPGRARAPSPVTSPRVWALR